MAEEITSPEMSAEDLKNLERMLANQREQAAFQLKSAEEAAKEIEKMLATGGNTLVTKYNLNNFLFETTQTEDKDVVVKASELTLFLKALLRPGIYDSVESAILDRVPEGTFIIIDDPNTDETEFLIEVVPYYDVEERGAEEAEAKAKALAEAAAAN
jgi:hypothetical protein